MLVDLAIYSFDAHVPDMVDVARAAEDLGYSAVWVTDHFSGTVVGAGHTRDPFVSLGAIAASTHDIDLGVLVANVVNRHPAQLASAVNSLQSLAPGRVRLGVGSGAAPGSRFAVEHDAIGRDLLGAAERRRLLAESIQTLDAIWGGETSHAGEHVGFDQLSGVVDGEPRPPIVVGASAWPTIEVAVRHADGVNLRRNSALVDHLDRLSAERPAEFEVSVLADVDDDVDRHALSSAGCDRLVLGVSTPFARASIERHAPAR